MKCLHACVVIACLFMCVGQAVQRQLLQWHPHHHRKLLQRAQRDGKLEQLEQHATAQPPNRLYRSQTTSFWAAAQAARQAAKRERALQWAWRAGNVGQLERTLRQRSPGVASALAHTRDALWQAQRARREALGLSAGPRAVRAHQSSSLKPASGGGASLPSRAGTGPSVRPGTTDAAGLPAGHANGFPVAQSAEARGVSSSPVREGSAALVSGRGPGPDGGPAVGRTGDCATSERAEAGAAEAALPVDAVGSGAGDLPECRWGAEGGAEPAGGSGLVWSGVSRRVVPARTHSTQANLVSGSSASELKA